MLTERAVFRLAFVFILSFLMLIPLSHESTGTPALAPAGSGLPDRNGPATAVCGREATSAPVDPERCRSRSS